MSELAGLLQQQTLLRRIRKLGEELGLVNLDQAYPGWSAAVLAPESHGESHPRPWASRVPSRPRTHVVAQLVGDRLHATLPVDQHEGGRATVGAAAGDVGEGSVPGKGELRQATKLIGPHVLQHGYRIASGLLISGLRLQGPQAQLSSSGLIGPTARKCASADTTPKPSRYDPTRRSTFSPLSGAGLATGCAGRL